MFSIPVSSTFIVYDFLSAMNRTISIPKLGYSLFSTEITNGILRTEPSTSGDDDNIPAPSELFEKILFTTDLYLYAKVLASPLPKVAVPT